MFAHSTLAQLVLRTGYQTAKYVYVFGFVSWKQVFSQHLRTFFEFFLIHSTSTTILIVYHSSEIRGLCSTKCSSETLQNLLYFMYKKTHVVFFVFHLVQLYFSPYECPGLCQYRPGHS